MNILLNTNTKGQIVIPQKIRKALQITPKVTLAVSLKGQSVIIQPVKDLVLKSDTQNTYSKLLQKTKGSWVGDNWETTKIKRNQIELKASKNRKTIW